jgi:hypothetical protein
MPSITNQVSVFFSGNKSVSAKAKKKTSRTNLALSKVVVPAGQMEEEL